MNTSEKLDEFAAKINASPEHIVDFIRYYHVELKLEGYYELMFSDDGPLNVHHAPRAEEADCTLKLSEKNFIELLDGDWESRKGIYGGTVKSRRETGARAEVTPNRKNI